MNELLQRHGCSNLFTIPEGLKELMSDISREVLREQPENICKFIANYLSALLLTREHGILAMKILDDLCDCRPSVSEHLITLGIIEAEAKTISEIVKEEIEKGPEAKKETIKEYEIIKKILTRIPLDEEMSAKVCQIARNAYRDYWYRKSKLEKSLKVTSNEPWEIAARRTLKLYERTKPSMHELSRATEKIQAAYKGYYIRRNLLEHLRPKKKKKGPKVDLLGPPLDTAASREIDLGPLINIEVREDDVQAMFDEHLIQNLSLPYDPLTAITHVPDEEEHLQELPAEDLSKIRQMDSRRSISPNIILSQVSREKEPSLLPSQESRKSRIGSQTPVDSTLQRISFSEVPPEVIPEEVFGEDVHDVLAPETTEASETGIEEDVSEYMQEDMEDIPEDITIDEDEGDETVLSSAPVTANTTDVEDEEEL